jgi:hypothetical protein
MLKEDKAAMIVGGKALDSYWRGAEAFHFYLLASRQFNNKQFKAAMLTVTLCL